MAEAQRSSPHGLSVNRTTPEAMNGVEKCFKMAAGMTHSVEVIAFMCVMNVSK